MISEKELLIKAKAGSNEAFEEIVNLYQQKVCSTIYFMVKNENIVEDLAQEVFIKVYKNISKFNEDSSLYTWIYRIAMNTCIDQIKKEKRFSYISTYVETEDGELEMQLEDESQKLDEIVENKIRKESLIKAIKSLPAEQRALIVLRDIRQFKYMEIAEMLNLNLGTVKSKISRARQTLKECLEKDGTIVELDESNV
ncbi:MAG: sigma-70 family RNA polymerase sigma factor [Clostridia bacterium]|nr:sigma-70 family RNA polymerase sigma factor [Clostridia bacterium]